MTSDDITWTCHICKRTRPDAMIGVHTTTDNSRGFQMSQNVRFCRDNDDCIEKAKTFTFFKVAP